MENERYPIELEVITPLSVGAGNDYEWTKGIDFIEKDHKVYVIDIQKAVEEGIDMSRLTDLFLKHDNRGIALLIGSKLEDVSKYIFDAPASTDNNIKTFLRTKLYDKPVVAGSSIKGAVRSALFKYLRDREDNNEAVFGKMKEGTDFMRFISIGDVEMSSTALVNSKIFNLQGSGRNWQGGWKHAGTRNGDSNTDEHYRPTGFNTLYECVLPGEKGIGNMTFAKSAFQVSEQYGKEFPHKEKKKELMNGTITDLFAIVNASTREYLMKERQFFEEYSAERSGELLDNIDYLLGLIPADNSSCLLKMSVGTGFHSITGDWKFDNHIEPYDAHPHPRSKILIPYKSRKTVEYGGKLQFMGFVRLHALPADEFKVRERTLEAEHKESIAQIVEPLERREAERQKAILEEQQRKAQAQEDAKKTVAFSELMEQANRYYIASQFDEAIAKATEAKKLCPDEAAADEIIKKCNDAKAAADYQKKANEDAQEKFKHPLPEVIKGKTSLGNLMGTIEKWLKINGKPFGEDEYAALVEAFSKLPTKEKNQMPKKQGAIIKAIGADFAKRLLAEKF